MFFAALRRFPVAAAAWVLWLTATAVGAAEVAGARPAFPRPLADYAGVDAPGLGATLTARAAADPFNVVATCIFVLAVLHTFLAGKFRHWAHVVEERHCARLAGKRQAADANEDGVPDEVSFGGQMLHFLGEVEAIFGIWAVVLGAAVMGFKGLDTAIHYIADTVNYTEPMFVVVIMALASTRPVLRLAEQATGGLPRRLDGLERHP